MSDEESGMLSAIRGRAQQRDVAAKVAAESLLDRQKTAAFPGTQIDYGHVSINKRIRAEIARLEDQAVELRALLNWLPNELPPLAEQALINRFQLGGR